MLDELTNSSNDLNDELIGKIKTEKLVRAVIT